MSANNPQKWCAFMGICLLSFGCYLDYTVVNVALPTIQQQLGASLTSLQVAPSSTQTENLRKLLANPAHASQINMNTELHTIFNDAFIHGFSSAMWFLFAISIAGFLSVLIWKIMTKKAAYVN